MGVSLTNEQVQEAVAALATHGTRKRAAAALGLHYTTYNSRLQRAEAVGLSKPKMKLVLDDDGIMPIPSSAPPLLHFEDAWKQWKAAIGMAKDRYTPPKPRKASDTCKVLVIPDLHAPFHEEAMFAATLEAEADADLVVCIGDLGDAYSLSRFEKYEHCPYRDEWASVTLVMQELASRFPRVKIVLGNHDVRLERQLRQRLTSDMVDAISFMTGGILCPISALARRYDNVEIASHVTPSGHTIEWFTSVGDAWLGHPEKFSKIPGSTLRGVEDWLSDNEHALGLDQYRLICVGHTHQAGLIPWRADKLLVETGCLCQQQGYMLAPKIGGRPQRRGYVTFLQHSGRTDLNSVKFTWLDAAA